MKNEIYKMYKNIEQNLQIEQKYKKKHFYKSEINILIT